MKHTHLDHEIRGDYYKKERDWSAYLLNTAIVLFVLWIVVEYVIGADEIIRYVEGI